MSGIKHIVDLGQCDVAVFSETAKQGPIFIPQALHLRRTGRANIVSIHIEPLAVPRLHNLTPDTIQRPGDCPIVSCSAISLYERQLENHMITEATLAKSLVREVRWSIKRRN